MLGCYSMCACVHCGYVMMWVSRAGDFLTSIVTVWMRPSRVSPSYPERETIALSSCCSRVSIVYGRVSSMSFKVSFSLFLRC